MPPACSSLSSLASSGRCLTLLMAPRRRRRNGRSDLCTTEMLAANHGRHCCVGNADPSMGICCLLSLTAAGRADGEINQLNQDQQHNSLSAPGRAAEDGEMCNGPARPPPGSDARGGTLGGVVLDPGRRRGRGEDRAQSCTSSSSSSSSSSSPLKLESVLRARFSSHRSPHGRAKLLVLGHPDLREKEKVQTERQWGEY